MTAKNKKIIGLFIITVIILAYIAFILFASSWKMVAFVGVVCLVGMLLWLGLWLFFEGIDEDVSENNKIA